MIGGGFFIKCLLTNRTAILSMNEACITRLHTVERTINGQLNHDAIINSVLTKIKINIRNLKK
jgi:hypothetical protein